LGNAYAAHILVLTPQYFGNEKNAAAVKAEYK